MRRGAEREEMMQAGRHSDPLASVFANVPDEAGPEVAIADAIYQEANQKTLASEESAATPAAADAD